MPSKSAIFSLDSRLREYVKRRRKFLLKSIISLRSLSFAIFCFFMSARYCSVLGHCLLASRERKVKKCRLQEPKSTYRLVMKE